MDKKLLPKRFVYLNVPRIFILTCLEKENLTPKERVKIIWFLDKTEKAIISLQHIRSVVEKVLDKVGQNKPLQKINLY